MQPKDFRLYDTMSRTVKPLQTVEPGHLKFYSCGPTVYSFAHIGNFRTFLSMDLVVRTAEALGWKVSYVSNITDVGHMTQDDEADASGEDKMEKGLKSKEGQGFANVWDLARYYADCFTEDWARLRLREPMVRPRATDHMREQIIAVEELIEKGHAYAAGTGVYFRLASFKDHGKLSGNVDKDQLQVAVRDVVVDENKEHPGDFALWKTDDKHLMQWFSPWGWGFPGWHIECSAMAMKYLGETIDLHGGGEDLVFPHHESEIAQSECLTGKVFSNHWMHVKFLQVEGSKMSKSKGNFYTVRDLVDKGHDPIALRFALIAVPYGKPMNFTMQSLSDAEKNVDRIREARRQAEKAMGKSGESNSAFAASLDQIYDDLLGAMCDDLNTSAAIAQALEGVSEIFRASETMSGADATKAIEFLNKVDAVLGIAPPEEEPDPKSGAEEELVKALIEQRNSAKQNRDYALADSIRAEAEQLGFILRDTPDGTEWRRKTVGAGAD